MRRLLCIASILLAASALVARDALRPVIHPQSDLPAFRCLVPDDWESKVDATGNLQLNNPARTAFLSLSFAHTPNPAEAHDSLARAVLGGGANPPWDSREPVEISGHRGFRYGARLKAGDATVRAELLIVEAGEHHLAACSAILNDRIKPADEATARLVLAPQTDAVALPATAIQTTAQGDSVIVVRGPDPLHGGTAQPVPVQVSRRVGDLAVIASGVKPGDVVVADGQLRVQPGAKVKTAAARGS